MNNYLKLPAHINNINNFREIVKSCMRENGFDEAQIIKVQMAVEEALVNVCNYAYPDKTGDVELKCYCIGEGCLKIELRDWGIPFNPLSVRDPDIKADLADRKIGGLGIFLIKNIMDKVSYRREKNANVLELIAYKKKT